MVRNVAFFLLIISLLLLSSCASAEIVRVMPGSTSVSSTQIHDATMGANNSIIFATDNGLSIYFCNSGGWMIMHPDYSDPRASIMDDYISSVEPDIYGKGWFGYPSALQTYDGQTFTTVTVPPILIENSVNDLQHRGSEMWVAVGNAGLIRFLNSSYEWFQPFKESGLNAYKIIGIAVDPSDNGLIAVSYDQGAWVLDEETSSFSRITLPADFKSLKGVKSNPFGGVYIFNSKDVYSYRDGRVSHVLAADTIDRWNVTQINDLTVSREGVMIVATDDGIAGYYGSEQVLRLKNRDGLGGYMVRFLFTDADGRIWYSVRDNVGYIYPLSDHMSIEIIIPATVAVHQTPGTSVVPETETPAGEATETFITETTAEESVEDEGPLAMIAAFFGSLWEMLMTPPQEML